VVFARRKGVKPADVLEPWTLGLAEMLAKKPKGALDEALAYFREVDRKVDAFFASGYDVWLTPVLRSPPPKIGEQAPTVPFDTLLERVTRYVSYTPVHNVAGTPAMSVPLGSTKSGLPIGSHFAARKGGEGALFALAYELEQARPWKDRRPPHSA
jgi:amidase